MNQLSGVFWAAVCLTATVAAGIALGQPTRGQPGYLPSDPRKVVVDRMCTGCHAVDWVTNHRDTKAGWSQLVDDMISRGANGTDDEVAQVVAYLSQNFASSNPGMPTNVPAAPVMNNPDLSAALPSRRVVPSDANSATRRPGADWPMIKGGAGGLGYSPLREITKNNVSRLKLAWTYETNTVAGTGPTPTAPSAARVVMSQVTPLVIDGVMYLTTPYGRAVALEADTGREIWSYNLPAAQGRPGLRSLAFWPGEAKGDSGGRIYFGTTGGFLVALDATTGKPASDFGDKGTLNLRTGMVGNYPKAPYSLTSPPVIYKNVMITGSMNQEQPALGAYGDLRAWDARTGIPLWTFHTIPRPGEANHDVWNGDSWKDRSGANAWGLMTVDTATGTLFAPLGSASYDYFGGDRPGRDLYADTLVAIDANSGKLKWHFQAVHHDVWDYDLAAAPALVDVKRGGAIIPAVAQITKQSLLFVLNRKTGKPIYPVEERPVPTDGFSPGEHPWPTQPFPVKPPPLARTGFDKSELSGITPEHKSYCESMLAHGRQNPPSPPPGPNGLRIATGLYTPFNQNGTLIFPTTLGGVNYHGLSYDPTLGYVYAAVMNMGEVFQAVHNKVRYNDDLQFEAGATEESGPPSVLRYYFGDMSNGWLCNAGPWGELVAVDVNTGEIAWRRPLGNLPQLEAMGVKNMGSRVLGGSISTAGGVTFIGGTLDNMFRAVDSSTGKDLWATDVGAPSHNLPLSYIGRDGKQYVAVLVSGGGYLRGNAIPPVVKAYSLPGAVH